MPTTTIERPNSATDAARTTDPGRAERRRDPWFDNAKFVLVALVVVGHSLVLTPGTTAHSWLYSFLYTWHIPAFVLVTGYLSRSFAYMPRRLWSLVCTVAVPYVVFSEALVLFRNGFGHEGLGFGLIDPKWPMWYLTALFAWRLVTPVFQRGPAVLAVGAAVVVSLVGGAVAPHAFDLARAAGLLPFFVLGLRVRPELLRRLQAPAMRFAGLLTLAGLFILAPAVHTLGNEYLYYRSSYAEVGDSLLLGGLTRAAVIVLGLVGALSVLALIPGTRTWMSRLGAASLVVYLFHGFFIKGWTYVGVPQWADAHPTLSLLILPAGAVLVATLLAQPGLATRLNSLADPIPWLVERLRPRMPADPMAPTHEVPVPTVPTRAIGS